ncbi:MAG TPA: hypothetical protein ENK91_15875 [Bacteroidetes bacterium]|nr:hypothetical protein [Bacteroidota bacterium]
MDDKIELFFYKKDGNDFEDFIVKLYKIKYPRLVGVKPQGSKGDGANDGYLSGELVLQVYAPEKIEAKKVIDKLEHDFQRAKKENWNFTQWHFVINDKFKNIHRDIHHKVDELKKINPNIDIRVVDTQTLKNMIYDLQTDNSLKIYVLLEMDRDISNFGDFEKFETIVDFLSKEQAIKNITTYDFMNFSKEVFLPDGIKKLEINIKDEYFSKTFGTYIEKSTSIIEEFKAKVGFDEFENVGKYIQDIYQKYEKKVISEQALLKTYKEIYSKIDSDQNLEISLWITIAYFFDICDIGAIE